MIKNEFETHRTTVNSFTHSPEKKHSNPAPALKNGGALKRACASRRHWRPFFRKFPHKSTKRSNSTHIYDDVLHYNCDNVSHERIVTVVGTGPRASGYMLHHETRDQIWGFLRTTMMAMMLPRMRKGRDVKAKMVPNQIFRFCVRFDFYCWWSTF